MSDANRIIRPDRRWRTKQYLVLATITAITAIAAGALHLILETEVAIRLSCFA